MSGLRAEPTFKQHKCQLPKSDPHEVITHEANRDIQLLLNSLSHAIKQSMVVHSDTEARRNVRTPRAYPVGQSFKTWLLQLLHYANLVHIKQSDRRAYLLPLLDQPAYKAVELLKLPESLPLSRAKRRKITNCSCERGVRGPRKILTDSLVI